MTEFHADLIVALLSFSCAIQMARYAEDSKKTSDKIIALWFTILALAFAVAALF